ncbi:MAG: hypothetical protein P4L46_10380 [Fimbriimonas sp.]|nr:hypothetical protein [Fimbriimonas sp.]
MNHYLTNACVLLSLISATSHARVGPRGSDDSPTPQVISKVAELPSNHAVKRGGVFDPDSGIEVTINPAAVALHIDPAIDAAAAGDIQDLDVLARASADGLSALKAFTMQSGERNMNGLFLQMGKLRPIFMKHKAFYDSFKRAFDINADLPAQWRFYFQQAPVLAASINDDLKSEIPSVQVQLSLSRDNDLSRTPQVPLGTLPGPQSKEALNQLMTSLGLSNTPGQTTPKDLADALVKKYQADIENDYKDLKNKAEALASGYQGQFKAILDSGDQTAIGAWAPIQANIDGIKAAWMKLEGDADTLLSMTPKSSADVQAFATQFDLVVAEAQTFAGLVQVATNAIGTAGIKGVQMAQDAEKKIKGLVDAAQTSANLLVEQAKNDVTVVLTSAGTLLGLVDQLTQIGQAFQTTSNGVATFHNSGKGLIGSNDGIPMPQIVSYDQLTIRVYSNGTRAASGKSVQIGEPYSIYAWKGNRFDTITAVGFFPRANTKHWGYSAIYGQAFKISSHDMSFDRLRFEVPGIGFSVESLDQQGNGTQSLGVGVLVTFFDDRLVGGYGFDTSGNGGYWYVGYRLRL